MTTAASNPHGGRNQQGEAQQWTGATVNNIQHRTHSKAPSTRTGFNQLQVTGPPSDEDDESTEGGHYGLRASISGLLDGQDDLDDLPTNEEGNDYWVNSRHLTSGNPAAPSEEEVTGMSFTNGLVRLITLTYCIWNSTTLEVKVPTEDFLSSPHPMSEPWDRSTRYSQNHSLREIGMLGRSGEFTT
jgi:hypothetical protein